jgi:hypothetical protein
MKNIRKILIHSGFLWVVIYLLTTSCGNRKLDGMIIVTQFSGRLPAMDLISGKAWRYIPGASIIAFDPEKPAKSIFLTEDFISACSPEISPDGRYMLFAAQRKHDETWQIWEMDLWRLKSRKITGFQENCTDPAYLPNGRVVFSKNTLIDTIKSGHTLYSCHNDGSDLKQITFHPHANFATVVLRDGRLLTISRQLFPAMTDPMYMIMRPDGTKADKFYKGMRDAAPISRGQETLDGRIFFVETDSINPDHGDVVSINYNRPLHSRVNHTAGMAGNFRSVLPMQSGKFLVSYRKTENEAYALYEFDPDEKTLGKLVYGSIDASIIDVLVVEKQVRPKRLPSEVDMGVKTGLILCQDIRITGMGLTDRFAGAPGNRLIEIMGMDSTLGVVQVEEDGSFYLKVTADTPFQIRVLDEKGQTANGSCSWIWLRPNERRGCIGCHEDPELVPDNNLPLAVKKDPISVPVDMANIGEKEVELE